MDAYQIIIENPFSPAWPILLGICAVLFLIAWTIDIVWLVKSRAHRKDGPWLAGLVTVAVLLTFLIGYMGNIQMYDTNARWDRVERALATEHEYSNIDLDHSPYEAKFSAEDSDGKYISGTIYGDTYEKYTVVIDK